jgi:hypothetical protein
MQQRRLAAARGAYQCDKLAIVDIAAEILDDLQDRKTLVYIL